MWNGGNSILIAPAGLAVEAKQEVWFASVLGLGSGLLIVLVHKREIID